MFKTSSWFILIFCLVVIFQCKAQDSLFTLQDSFSKLSNDDFSYNLVVEQSKDELYFKTLTSGKISYAYKLLVKDIHPKGIYLHEVNGKYTLRIISLNNGNVFINEDHRGKYMRVNTNSYVDIGSWGKQDKMDLFNFVIELEKFVNDNKIKDIEVNDEDLDIIILPQDGNGSN